MLTTYNKRGTQYRSCSYKCSSPAKAEYFKFYGIFKRKKDTNDL